ncbi:MAG TPA: TadE/TadG family type IV pilus assembly protein [Candidatus Limnocylindria bacterium]
MKLPIVRRSRRVSRGQAMVEFAILLPVLILLLLLALDFGRVFFGWIALNNVSRIGANEAARFPTPWANGDPMDASDPYYQRMIADMASMNCDADSDNDGDIDENDLPAPAFIERAGTSTDPYEVGDEVSVTLHCDFSFLTPLVGAIVGDPLNITATTTFLVFGGEINGIPVQVDPVPAGCIGSDKTVPDLVGMTVDDARNAWTSAGFTGSFNPSTAPAANIVLTQTTSPNSSPGSCLLFSGSVTVTHKVPDGCANDEALVPNLVTSPAMTVAQARAAWTGAGFSGGFTPLTGSDTDQVTGMTVSPTNAAPNTCAKLTSGVNVAHSASPPPVGQCTMPQTLGMVAVPTAKSAYTSAGFTGTFSYSPNKPSWYVHSQNLVGGQSYACSASLSVQVQSHP